MFVTLILQLLTSAEGATFTALVVSAAFKYVSLCRTRAARDKLFTLVGHVSELTVYPIKACGGVELQSATATDIGLCADGYYDRRWIIQSKESGKFVNMKDDGRLTLVTSTVDGDWLVIAAPDMTPLCLPRHPDPTKFRQVRANVNGTTIQALDAGSEASDWMTHFLQQPVRLLHSGPGVGLRDAHDRFFSWENCSRRGDKAVFSYLTAYMLTTTASLSELNSRLDSRVISRHFRPNIEVDTTIPFDEDNWEEIRIGTTAKFHYVQPCLRCVITTVDPKSAERSTSGQPLAMLRSYRKRPPYGAAPVFGAYIAIDSQGPVKVGDPVYAIRRQSTVS